jgi:hypothetical protein
VSATRKSTKRPRGFVTLWRPQAKTKSRLVQVSEVVAEYRKYLPLTCRQIFYRLVGAYSYPKTERSYKNLCDMLVMARRAQMFEFSHIRDDDAPLPRFIGFDDVGEFVGMVSDMAGRLHLDRQARTRPGPYVVVLCEARGMVPQLERVAGEFSVPVLGSGGFDSLTFKFTFARWVASLGRPVEVLHIGDHDPSGVHVFSNFGEDVGAFVAHFGGEVSLSRLVVIPGQAIAWGLPTAPRKKTDRRRFDGIGGDPDATVQAEAVPPDILSATLRDALEDRISAEVRAAAELDEAIARRRLATGFRRLLPAPDGGSTGA